MDTFVRDNLEGKFIAQASVPDRLNQRDGNTVLPIPWLRLSALKENLQRHAAPYLRHLMQDEGRLPRLRVVTYASRNAACGRVQCPSRRKIQRISACSYTPSSQVHRDLIAEGCETYDGG